MKKLLLLCLILTLSVNFYAQETKTEKAKTAVKKTANKVAKKTEKATKTTKTAVTKTADKVADKTSKAAKSVKKESKKVAAKAETKTKKAAAATKAEVKKDAKKVEAKTKGTTKVKETNEKAPKIADKVTGTYNGKKVYTGPRGGRYYINANGNKTYIQD